MGMVFSLPEIVSIMQVMAAVMIIMTVMAMMGMPVVIYMLEKIVETHGSSCHRYDCSLTLFQKIGHHFSDARTGGEKYVFLAPFA